MNIRSFLIYFYFRVFELYKGPSRSDGPVALIISLNFSVVVNLLFLIFNLWVPLSPLKPLLLSMIISDCALFLITFCICKIYLYKNRKLIGKQFELFRKETIIERIKNARKIWLYMGLSILSLVITYVLS
jgi:hypothetical protein